MRPWVSTRPTTTSPLGFRGAGRGEHGEGLAHTGRGAKEDLELPATFFLGERKESVGRGSLRLLDGHSKASETDFTAEIPSGRAVHQRARQKCLGVPLRLAELRGSDSRLTA